ncbi:MAG: glutathione S-transferase family protein [Gammaproteobacteria bacterium]|nr:glutathione S-transferase family protein [Gammaproteobacteria bacterium]
MMITLYQFSTSPFAEKVRRALNYKGISFDIHEVARARVAERHYERVSPTGKFPTIEDGDTIVWDSTDILYHLERAHGGPPLVPSSARDAALAHAIEEWADESLYFYEMTMRLTWEHNLDAALDEFARTLPGVPKPRLKSLIVEAATGLTEAQGVGRKPRDQVVRDVVRHFEALDGLLDGRTWLVGDALSIADLAVIAQVNALRYAKEAEAALTGTHHVLGWIDRVDLAAPR